MSTALRTALRQVLNRGTEAADEGQIWEILKGAGKQVHFDTLRAELGCSVAELSQVLTLMALQGKIMEMPGRNFVAQEARGGFVDPVTLVRAHGLGTLGAVSEATHFDADYTGPRWTYGLNYRPLGYGQVPDGWIIKSDRPSPQFRHGTVDYPFELPADKVKRFEMTLVKHTPAREQVSERTLEGRDIVKGLSLRQVMVVAEQRAKQYNETWYIIGDTGMVANDRGRRGHEQYQALAYHPDGRIEQIPARPRPEARRTEGSHDAVLDRAIARLRDMRQALEQGDRHLVTARYNRAASILGEITDKGWWGRADPGSMIHQKFGTMRVRAIRAQTDSEREEGRAAINDAIDFLERLKVKESVSEALSSADRATLDAFQRDLTNMAFGLMPYHQVSIPGPIASAGDKLLDAIQMLRRGDAKGALSIAHPIAQKYQGELGKGDYAAGPKEVKTGSALKKLLGRAALSIYHIARSAEAVSTGSMASITKDTPNLILASDFEEEDVTEATPTALKSAKSAAQVALGKIKWLEDSFRYWPDDQAKQDTQRKVNSLNEWLDRMEQEGLIDDDIWMAWGPAANEIRREMEDPLGMFSREIKSRLDRVKHRLRLLTM